MNFPFLPTRASTFAVQVDQLGLVLTLLTVFFTTLVMVLLTVFAIRYRRGSKVDRSNPKDHSYVLEIGWSVIPLILGLCVFIWAAIPFTQVFNPPKDAEEILVVGKQWMWHIQHMNGIRENNELHVPVGKPFKLTLISQDVIHGFYIPAFRIKRDALPGWFNTVWFQATEPGKYHIFCTEYCGTNHSEMTGWVYVMTPGDYAQWLKTGASGVRVTAPQTVAQVGQDLYTQLACGNCHKNEDSVRAPSLVGIYGTRQRLASGGTATIDENFLRQAIRKPQDNLVAGYGQLATMPDYPDTEITEEQVHDLIVYIRSMGGAPPPGAGAYQGGAQPGPLPHGTKPRSRAPAAGPRVKPTSQSSTPLSSSLPGVAVPAPGTPAGNSTGHAGPVGHPTTGNTR
jgi:cytochrome c oxidase subunit 2